MARNRYVYVRSKPGDEFINGQSYEIRADSEEEASMTINKIGGAWGFTAKLIGMREGMGSDARFFPLIPVSELPEYIVQNERVTIRPRKVA